MIVIFVFAALWFLLTLTGIGWARLALRGARWPESLVWTLAPVFGAFAVIAPSFALFRFIGPVSTWGLYLTAVLVLGSLAINQWVTQASGRNARKRKWASAQSILPVLALLILLPAVIGGESFTLFRSNSSDANNYQTLAEATQRAAWSEIARGGNLGSPADMASLAAKSPTALLSARLTLLPVRMNSMLFLAWASTVTFQPVFRVYYAASLLFVFLHAALVWGAGSLLGMGRLTRNMTSAAVGLGFWSYLSLELDTISQIQIAPFLLLFVVGTVAWFRWKGHARRRSALVLGTVGLSGLLLIYPESASFAVIALLLAGALLLAAKSRSEFLRYQTVCALCALVVLTASLQIDFIYRTQAFIVRATAGDPAFPSEVIENLQQQGIGFISGFVAPADRFPAAWVAPLNRWGVTVAWGALASAALALVGVLWRSRHPGEWLRVLVAVPVAGLMACVILHVRGSDYLAGKFLMWSAPFWVILLGVFASLRRGGLTRVTRGSTVWHTWPAHATLACLAAFVPIAIHLAAADASLLTVRRKEADFDLSPLIRVVQSRRSSTIRIDVPPSGNWAFAMHVMRVFQDVPGVGFASGYVWDNRDDKDGMMFPDLVPEHFDFLLVRKSNGPPNTAHVGLVRVAETADLLLYEATRASK